MARRRDAAEEIIGDLEALEIETGRGFGLAEAAGRNRSRQARLQAEFLQMRPLLASPETRWAWVGRQWLSIGEPLCLSTIAQRGMRC